MPAAAAVWARYHSVGCSNACVRETNTGARRAGHISHHFLASRRVAFAKHLPASSILVTPVMKYLLQPVSAGVTRSTHESRDICSACQRKKMLISHTTMSMLSATNNSSRSAFLGAESSSNHRVFAEPARAAAYSRWRFEGARRKQRRSIIRHNVSNAEAARKG